MTSLRALAPRNASWAGVASMWLAPRESTVPAAPRTTSKVCYGSSIRPLPSSSGRASRIHSWNRSCPLSLVKLR